MKLTDVARLETGHTPSRRFPEYWDGDIPWLSISDAREHHGRRIFETQQRVTQLGIDNSAARVLPAGTVCLSRTASVGYVVILGTQMATSQDFVDWVCSDALVPEFLMYLLLAESDSLHRFGKGTTHTTIYFPEVKAFHVCIPPVAEQRRIVAELDRLRARTAAARDALGRTRDGLPALRQSILAAAFRGDMTADWREKNPDAEPASVLLDRIRKERRHKWEEAELAKMQAKGKTPTDDQWKQKYVVSEPAVLADLPQLPQAWLWASLEELTDPVRLIRYGMLMPGPNIVGGRPYVKVLHMRDDALDASNLPRTTDAMWSAFAGAALAKGDILLSIRGTYGRVALVPDAVAGANITQDSARIAPLVDVNREYLAAMLRSPYGQKYLHDIAKGVAVKGVNIQDIRPMAIPLAPFTEQQAIAKSVAAALQTISDIGTHVTTALTSLSDLESTILAKAFLGELVPQDPNDQPASVLLERIRTQRVTSEGESNGKRRTKSRGRESSSEPEPAAIAAATTTRLPIRRGTPKTDLESPRLTIDVHPLEDLLAAIRRVVVTGDRDRETLIREVARELGFARIGARVHAAIDSAINAASRRLVIRSERGVFTLYSPSIEHYDKDELKQLFLSAIGTTWWDRDEAIRATARYLGFKRTGDKIDNAIRSVINGLIRTARLERNGNRLRKV